MALSRFSWPELRTYERVALQLTAGLGLTALLLSIAALTGWFFHASAVLGVLTALGGAVALRHHSRRGRRVQSVDVPLAPPVDAMSMAVFICAALACLGAIAPVTDDDALAYVVPIARHIAETGTVRVWVDQARSMWPQSQEVLLAYLLHAGSDRLGALTAFEWLLTVGVVSALARRVCERSEHVGAAMIIGLGAPVVAFQVASAKEDLLLLAASAAAAFCLAGRGERAELAAAGLFAGIAAGAKYPGAIIAAAAVAWPLIRRGERPFRGAALVAVCAAATGGLWYALNIWRYGNPVAPFVGGAPGTPLDAAVVREFMDGYGGGKSPLAFFLAPARIFVESSLFGGRANLYNPLVYAGLAGLLVSAQRRRTGPLFFMAAVLYGGWFVTVQIARLLLPAAVLLAPAAADRLVPLMQRRRSLHAMAWGATALSLGVVASVGVVRAGRYIEDPRGFLASETQNYVDIQWMNAHLDRRHDRVASDHKVLAYLDVPSLILDPSYQIEISDAELNDAGRFLDACRRQRITHLFGNVESFPSVRGHLRTIYSNPSSRLGGVRFFREPPTESTAVFEIVYPPNPVDARAGYF
jgi:hypothetical protein